MDTDEGDAVDRGKAPGKVTKQQPPAEGDARGNQVDDILAQPSGREAHKRDVVSGRRLVGDQLVGRIDAELRFGRTRGRTAPQPRKLLAQQVASALVRDCCHPVAFGLGEYVRGIPPVVGVHLPVNNLPGGGRHRIEEPAIVGDRHDGSARAGTPCRQVVSEPCHPFDIKMVGRLVQEQQVVVGDQKRSERQTATLTTRERTHDRLQAAKIWGFDAAEESLQNLANARVTGPDVLRQLAQRCPADGRLGIEGVDLAEHADGQRPDPGDAPFIDGLESGQDPEKGGLATTIAPDDAHTGVAADAERHAIKDAGGAEGQRGALDRHEICHGLVSCPWVRPAR